MFPVCFCRSGLRSPFLPNVVFFYLNYVESTKFRWQYSHALAIQFMFQGLTLIIVKYLPCAFVTNAISEVHGYALF
jgi:hypothetical protein